MAAGIGIAVAGYATYAAITWYRFGNRQGPVTSDEQDDFLDQFMPVYDVAERHHIRVSAPAAVTLTAACEQDLLQQPFVRAIVKAREAILGATADARPLPRGLCAQMTSIGWVVLAESTGRELLFGAVTRPWEPNVTFRSIPPEQFYEFDEPDYVKIVWTLRADPIGPDASIFRTETRAIATDAVARDRFRLYWAAFSPGIKAIRRLSLAPLKRAAEQSAREGAPPGHAARV